MVMVMMMTTQQQIEVSAPAMIFSSGIASLEVQGQR
jgi:hypothetical protein